MEICDILKKIRSALGMTQIMFAQKIHVSFSTVNRWENGKVKPNNLALATIIEFSKLNGIEETLIRELQNKLSTVNANV